MASGDGECTALMCAGENNARRSVVMIESEQRTINVVREFYKLDPVIRRTLRRRFDNWIDGYPNPKQYHGWTRSQFGGLYADLFGCKAQEHRLYGFVDHPKAPQDPRYETCVLTLYATKQAQATDESELRRVKEVSTSKAVMTAVRILLLAA